MFKLDYEPHYINELDDILNEAMENGISTNRQNISFYNIVCAFDIESTSFTDKITKEDHNEKRSIMYIWQLAINGRVIIGRTWSEDILQTPWKRQSTKGLLSMFITYHLNFSSSVSCLTGIRSLPLIPGNLFTA